MDNFETLKKLISKINWKDCILFSTDSYKYSHFEQYPEGTTKIYSYIEPRSIHKEFGISSVIVMGVQYFINKYLMKPITMKHVEAANLFARLHGIPFNYNGWKRIVEKCNGYLPIEIKAVKEGSSVRVKNAICTVTNTDDEFPWIVNYIEAALLRSVWYQTTVATYSNECKKVILESLAVTSYPKGSPVNWEDYINSANFNLHDFGARGVSSGESAMIGGAAHIGSFMGSDTIEGILSLIENTNPDSMPAFSVPAAEHSTVTIYLRDGEKEAILNMINKFKGKFPIISFVADSYDLWNNINMVCVDLIDEIRASGLKYVIRPDSGNPAKTILKVFEHIKHYGLMKLNENGYYELPDYLGVLQGDGIDLRSLKGILDTLTNNKFSSKGLVFGMGGKLLQSHSRDDFGFAMKCSYAIVNGEPRDVFKDPVTDSGKRSKKGMLKLITFNRAHHTVSTSDDPNWECYPDELESKYKNIDNGIVVSIDKFEDIKKRISSYI